METDKTTNEPQLVPHDFSVEISAPVPKTLQVVGKLVHWNGTPNFGAVGVLLEPDFEVKPGQFLASWHGKRNADRLTVIQVADCAEVNPNEDPQLSVARDRLGLGSSYAGEGTSTRIFRLANCDTVEEFDVSYDAASKKWKVLNGHAPEALARAGDPVVLLPPEIAQEAIGSLDAADKGVHLGATYGPNPVEVVLPTHLYQMHIGIFGNPGKGKSYLGGVMMEEAFSWQIPTLVLDVNGEMADAAREIGGLVITLPDPKAFGLSLNLITPAELISIVPNLQPNTNYAELIEHSHDQLRQECREDHISFKMLKDRIEKNGPILEIKAPSIRTAVGRLGALENDPLIGQSFDFIKMLEKHRMVVLDCRFLSLRQTRLIAASAARVLQAHGRKMARKANEEKDAAAANWFSLFFVDEAHAVAPNHEEVVSTQVLYELARMGRHVRTGLILASQSPSDLDPSILKRLQTRFVFALEQDQLRSIGGVVADLNSKILTQLPKLPRGICAVSGSSELIRHGFLLQVKKRKTKVGGGTPPVFGSRKKHALEIK